MKMTAGDVYSMGGDVSAPFVFGDSGPGFEGLPQHQRRGGDPAGNVLVTDSLSLLPSIAGG
jgi:hypothetical protein